VPRFVVRGTLLGLLRRAALSAWSVCLMAARHFTNVLDGCGSLFRGVDYLVPIWGTTGPIWGVPSDANRRLLRDDELVE
jgi:hypothetical protein